MNRPPPAAATTSCTIAKATHESLRAAFLSLLLALRALWVRARPWNQDALLAAIERRAFAAILLYQPRTWQAIRTRWTPEQRNTIYAHYRQDQIRPDVLVYLPAGEASSR